MRRFATIALSLCLLLGLAGSHRVLAQADTKKDETPKTGASKPEAAKDETPKPDASAATEQPAPIPPEVEAKLEVARRAVAEAIVAAQDAGLVKSTIDPPPILDILITGRASDEATLKARTGVSPEVFGAWFSGYGVTKDINPQKDVRIIRPDAGLKEMYNQRANILNRHIEAVRKAQGVARKDEIKVNPPADKPKDEAKPDKPKDEPKPEPAKEDKAEEKKDAPKDGDAKKDEPKPEQKPDEAKKDTNDGNPPKDDAKKDDTKSDASKDDTPK